MERFTHGGDIYGEPNNWLDFSANINPLGAPPKAKEAVMQNIDNIINYPDFRNKELKEAISYFYHIPSENIILGNGASELIYLYFSCLRPKKTLIVAPSFSDYERAALAFGSQVDFLCLKPENNFDFPLEALKVKSKNYDCVIFGNPNNPTGSMIKREYIKDMLQESKNASIFIDESFLDFREDREKYETLGLAAKEERLFTLRSLTKFYAIPGLRLGFGVTNKNLTVKLSASIDVWNINLLAAKAGVAAINDEEYRKKTLAWLKTEQEFLTQELTKLNIKFFPPTVNFILCKFETKEKAAKIREGLKELGILVRNCENFVSLDAKFTRIAIKSRNDNEILIESLKEIIGATI